MKIKNREKKGIGKKVWGRKWKERKKERHWKEKGIGKKGKEE